MPSKYIHDYTTNVELNKKMRMILTDWMHNVRKGFNLSYEALYLAFQLIDRYLAYKHTHRNKFQLVGITCFCIAQKYVDDIWEPYMSDYTYVTDDSYSISEMVDKEMEILVTLDFDFKYRTTYDILLGKQASQYHLDVWKVISLFPHSGYDSEELANEILNDSDYVNKCINKVKLSRNLSLSKLANEL